MSIAGRGETLPIFGVQDLSYRRDDQSLSFQPTGGILLYDFQTTNMKNGIKMPQFDIYYVYLLSNWNNKVLYIGVTNNLERRTIEHKQKLTPGFTEKYNVNKLVCFEHTEDVISAIRREKQLKKWRREKKNALVNSINPSWKDLTDEW